MYFISCNDLIMLNKMIAKVDYSSIFDRANFRSSINKPSIVYSFWILVPIVLSSFSICPILRFIH